MIIARLMGLLGLPVCMENEIIVRQVDYISQKITFDPTHLICGDACYQTNSAESDLGIICFEHNLIRHPSKNIMGMMPSGPLDSCLSRQPK